MRLVRAVFLWVAVLQFIPQTAVAGTDARLEASAITCKEGASERILLRSTDRLPEASGAIRVERRGGTTEIEADLTSMKPAALFGGDYNTYVLWIVPPRAAAENLGEVQLDGDRGKLHGSTSASAFAILVTAEPHYLVNAPSAFVVLENKPDPAGHAIQQPLIEGVYNFHRSTLSDVKEATGKVHSEVRQALTAVRLAQRAGAAAFAADELAQAQRALEQTLTLWHERKNRTEIAAQARKTVSLAVAAQRLAQDRALLGTRTETEGTGGGKIETEGRNLRGPGIDWR
jgi:hypothetical protein